MPQPLSQSTLPMQTRLIQPLMKRLNGSAASSMSRPSSRYPSCLRSATVSASEWDRMFAVNVRGTMLTNQAAHRHMKVGGGGSIINFGSISGQRSEPGAVAYSAAKGAVHSWTRSAAALGERMASESTPSCPPLRPRCTTRPCRDEPRKKRRRFG